MDFKLIEEYSYLLFHDIINTYEINEKKKFNNILKDKNGKKTKIYRYFYNFKYREYNIRVSTDLNFDIKLKNNGFIRFQHNNKKLTYIHFNHNSLYTNLIFDFKTQTITENKYPETNYSWLLFESFMNSFKIHRNIDNF